MKKFIPGTIFLAGSAAVLFLAQWPASLAGALGIGIGGSVAAFTVATVIATFLGFKDSPPGIH